MLSTAQASKELGPQSRQEIRDRAGFGFPSGGGESRERCGDGDITWAVRGPPAVAGEKPRKSAFQSTSHWHLPCQGAGHEDAPKPVRNTHRTQAPLTRRVPFRRRPQSLCARSRGWQRRGRGQFAVTGGVTAEGAASLRAAGWGLLLRVLRFWARLLTAAGAGDRGSRSLAAAGTSGSPRLSLGSQGALLWAALCTFSVLDVSRASHRCQR